MEKSQFENIGNAQLFFVIKNIGVEVSLKEVVKSLVIMEDNDFLIACDNAGKIVGIELEFPIDHNYLAATIKLNPNYDFSALKPTVQIKRPEGHTYSYDIDEFRTEYIRRTYRNEMTSYSVDLIKSTFWSMQNDGYYDYYDGNEVDVDYYDSETTDISFDKTSIKLIE